MRRSKPPKMKGTGFAYRLKQENGWNLMLSNLNRNDPCICGSMVKLKKCCLDKIPKYVPKDVSEKMKGVSLEKQKLVFNEYLKQKRITKEITGK